MGKTLFWYVFWDLMRVFGLASGALAGIMSFGGLLRPLTRQGLGAAEVGEMLIYFMPAMSTYSLPVAALFATTLVYGRLSADNEITAMRAGGISHFWAVTPGLLLGLVVAFMSLGMLCFVVPASTQKVERVLYSNVAQWIDKQVERYHYVRFQDSTIYAQTSRVVTPEGAAPGDQLVVLDSPLFMSYDYVEQGGVRLRVPREFNMARRATVRIRQDPKQLGDQVEVTAILEGGTSFPRRFAGGVQGGVEVTQYGPVEVRSPLAEKSKFMDLYRLRSVYADPGRSRRVSATSVEINRRQQQREFVARLAERLTDAGEAELPDQSGDRYVLTRGGATLQNRDGELVLVAAPDQVPPRLVRSAAGCADAGDFGVTGRRVVIRPAPDDASALVFVDLVFEDANILDRSELTATSQPADAGVRLNRYRRTVRVPMPPTLVAAGQRGTADLLVDATLAPDLAARLRRDVLVTRNEVVGELNSRMAFAVSCLILVLVGVALGMMFRSGHFLSAFGVSVIPAMLCIMLNVTGQHTLENVPRALPANWHNPHGVGQTLIWAGNAAVSILAGVLLYRLQKK